MVVDDDSQVRTFLKSALTKQGYHVLEARHGPAAVAIALRHAGPIHLLVTDMLMPEMTGRELAEALRIDLPRLAVLYLSGLHEDSATGGEGKGLDTFVQKPFKMTELLLKVRQILDKCTGQK
jgi:DNA-binding response OmpR family regulator